MARNMKVWGGACALLAVIGLAYADPEAANKLAKERGVVFAHELDDVPGKNLVAVKLEFSPRDEHGGPRSMAHRHPGSTYVYVLTGTLRLGIAGQPVQVVHAGESFFEPTGAVHTVAENASTKEPASALAVLIVPDGASILTPVEGAKP